MNIERMNQHERCTYLGPSLRPIETTMCDIDRFLNEQPPELVRGMDGSLITRSFSEEELIAMIRFDQLRELTSLRDPVGPGWRESMFANCCDQ